MYQIISRTFSRGYTINLTYAFLFIVLLLVPCFDSITGYLVMLNIMSEGGVGTPSQLIRAFVILISIMMIRSKSRYKVLMISSLYLVTMEVMMFLAYFNLVGLLIGLVFSYKFIYSFIVFFALEQIIRREQFSERKILELIGSFTLSLLILFHFGNVIGIAKGLYPGIVRTHGLFPSANGMGVLLGALSLMNYYRLLKVPDAGKMARVIYILNLFTLLLIATKAALIFLLLNMLILFFRSRGYIKLLVITPLVIGVLIFRQKIGLLLQTIFEVVIFRFEHKTSWLGFILSGREQYIEDAFEHVEKSQFLPLRILFGGGSFLSYETADAYSLKYKMLETDLFDTFFMYGFVGLFFYFSIFIWATVVAFRKSSILGLLSMTLFLHSMMAGHTMYNGLAAMSVVWMLLLVRYKPAVASELE